MFSGLETRAKWPRGLSAAENVVGLPLASIPGTSTGLALGAGSRLAAGVTDALAVANSYAQASNSVVIGNADPTGLYGATAVGGVAIGYHTKASNGVSIGTSLTTGGTAGVLVGLSLASYGSGNVVLGNGSNAGDAVYTGSSNVVIGPNNVVGNASTVYGTSNNVVLGSSNACNWGSNNTQLGVGHASQGDGASLVGAYAQGYTWSFGIGHSAPWAVTTAGKRQDCIVQYSAYTPGSAATEAFLGGTTNNRMALQDNSLIAFQGRIIAKQNGGTNYSWWTVSGAIRRASGAATTTLVGSATVTWVASGGTWTNVSPAVPTITADTTNGGLKLTVAGVAATNIEWGCTLNTTEVAD